MRFRSDTAVTFDAPDTGHVRARYVGETTDADGNAMFLFRAAAGYEMPMYPYAVYNALATRSLTVDV